MVLTPGTVAGANIVSGPDLRVSDREGLSTAYGGAYCAARPAQGYGGATSMKIARVLTIRDRGGVQCNHHLPSTIASLPVVITQASAEEADASGRVMAGQTTGTGAVHADFALVPS